MGSEYLMCSQNIRTWQSETCQPALLRPATSHPALQNMSPCGRSLTFLGAKNATAALISPSKRQKRHRGPDRPKIRPSQERSESRQFKLSQFLKSVGFHIQNTKSVFGPVNIPRLPILLWKFQFGSWAKVWAVLKLSTALSLAEQISMFIQVWRGFYIWQNYSL